jgi:hypothetical protein
MKLFIILFSFSGILLGSAQTNGLYVCNGSKQGTQITTVDSQTVYIQKKINLSKVFIFSMNNENTQFMVELIVPKINQNNATVLSVNGQYFLSSSSGSSNDIYSVSFIVNKNEALEIAKVLGTTVNLRKHFGHQLTFEFVPLRNDYKVGDSIYVNFKITNQSEVSVWYNSGGMYRNSNGRCDYFDFEVYRNGILLADEGPEWNFGGLEARPELKPHQTDSIVECITKWTPFREPGKYVIKCSYRLHLQNELNNKNYPENQADLHKAWDEKAEKTIEITITE